MSESVCVQARKTSPVVFFGAGASAPFGFPPTRPFLEELKKHIPESPDSRKTSEHLLRPFLKVEGVEDAEHLIQLDST